jgi:hypothetical protein
MTYRQLKWSGLFALILLVILLDIWFNWRLFVLTFALAIYFYSLGRSKPAVVRIVQYPPRKLDVTDEMRRAMDLTPGRER